jgi:tetratricopeptide (TPR) repeat protein
MALASTLRLQRRFFAGRRLEGSGSTDSYRLLELTSLMIVLGTIRLVCSTVDYSIAFYEGSLREPSWVSFLGEFFTEHHPIVALCAAWPLFMAIALRRVQWHQLLPAAGATFLILALGGILELVAEWANAQGDGVTVGSFHISRRAFLHTTALDVALVVIGLVQLALELVAAACAFWLFGNGRHAQSGNDARLALARRARYGRLALYVSLGFMVVMIRLPVWATYVEILNNSPIVRQYVLQTDDRPRRPRRSPRLTPEEQRMRELQNVMAKAYEANQRQQFLVAKDAYTRAIALVDATAAANLQSVFETNLAEALNNLAWLLATCPEVALREPKAAVDYARRAVELRPANGNYWNTLGVAHYRAGDWLLSEQALKRSMQNRNEGDSADWFFLAIDESKLGRGQERARAWYDKAVTWFHDRRPADPELFRFQVEAATALGLPAPEQPPINRNSEAAMINVYSLPKRGRGMIVPPAPE